MTGEAAIVVVSAESQEEALLPAGLVSTDHDGSTRDGRGQQWLDVAGMENLRAELLAVLDTVQASEVRGAVDRALELVDFARRTGTGVALVTRS